MLKHEGETPGHGQLEGNHQFLFSNEDFFILLLLYSSPKNAHFLRFSDIPNFFFNTVETSPRAYYARRLIRMF